MTDSKHSDWFLKHAREPLAFLRNGVIETANSPFAEILGRPTKDVVGRPLNSFITPRDAAKLKTALSTAADDWITLSFTDATGSAAPRRLRVRKETEAGVEFDVVSFEYAGASMANDAKASQRQDDAVAELAAKNRAILDAAVDAILTIDDRGIIQSVNPAAVQMFGYAAAEMVGHNVSMLMPDPERELHDGYLRAYRQGSEDKIIGVGREVKAVRRDGSVFCAHLAVSEIGGAGRRQFIGSLRDISQLKAVEQALRTSEERLRQSQMFANIGTWDWNIQTGELYWSERIAPLFGYPPGQLETTYENFLKAVHPEDRQRVIDAVNACVEKGAEYNIEHRCVWPDGSVRWMLERGDVVRDTAGAPLRMLGVVQDITPRKHAESALRASERRLREAQSIAHLGHWSWDLRSGEMQWSDEIYRVLRVPRDSIPTHEKFLSLIHPSDLSLVVGAERRALETGEKYSVDHRVIVHGRVRWVHGEAIATTDLNGKPTGLSGTLQDITERKHNETQLLAAKEQAEQANRAKSEFLSNMSHEFRTPLNAILGFSELLDLDETLRGEHRDNVREIQKAGKHLLDLVNEILDLAKIEAGRVQLSMESVTIGRVVDECLTLLRGALRKRQITIETHLGAFADASIHADWLRLKQVFLNLLSNAVKYNRPNGIVRLGARPAADGMVRITISDEGEGFTPTQVSHLFEPFNRLGREASVVEGSGIGLVLTKRLVEVMGGTIGVESEVGAGATFWVEFLLDAAFHDRARAMVNADQDVAAEKPGRRVLIVEDNPTNRLVMEQQLKLLGFTPVFAANGSEGLATWRNGVFDVILTDINMPGMSGYELTVAIRAEEKRAGLARTPVIAISANALDGKGKDHLLAGMDDYLVKPVYVEDLQRALDEHLVSRSTVDEESESALTATTSSAKPSPVDYATLGKIFGDNEELYFPVLKSFVENAPESLSKIDEAFAQRDAKNVVFYAHKLKSSARTIGATAVGECCANVEEAGKSGDWTSMQRLREILLREFAALDRHIKELDKQQVFVGGRADVRPVVSAKVHSSPLRVVVVDDDKVVLEHIEGMLRQLGVNNVTVTTDIEEVLDLFRGDGNIDLLLCDLNMPDVDGIELMRHLSNIGYKDAIALISGEDDRILSSAAKLAGAHNLNLVGTLNKPVQLPRLIDVLAKIGKGERDSGAGAVSSVDAADLRGAIERNEIFLHYQPKVDVENRRVIGAEALARWQHPQHGAVSPAIFVPLAEESGLIDALTDRVLQQATNQAKLWRNSGLDMKIAVNLSVDTIHRLDLPEVIVSHLYAAGLDPSDLILEVTESRLMQDVTVALDVLTRLRLKGFMLSLDDFGTGYSTLEQLKRIPFVEMKLDRSFVTGVADDSSARAIIESSVDLAKKLNMKVVAEGVETQPEWDIVAELGCNVIQGFFIAKPMPAEEFTRWCEEYRRSVSGVVTPAVTTR